MGDVLVIVIVVLGLAATILLFLVAPHLNLYVQARLSSVPVSLMDIIGMRLRKVDPRKVVIARIVAMKAGLDLEVPEMEAHVLKGGDLESVLGALVAARKGGLDLSWEEATEMDLAGQDVRAEIQKIVAEAGPPEGEQVETSG